MELRLADILKPEQTIQNLFVGIVALGFRVVEHHFEAKLYFYK